MTNLELAGRARQAADEAMRDRRAWLVLAVALGETRTVAAARGLLAQVGVDVVRERAGVLLGSLTEPADADPFAEAEQVLRDAGMLPRDRRA